jgi:hypothetical protein
MEGCKIAVIERKRKSKYQSNTEARTGKRNTAAATKELRNGAVVAMVAVRVNTMPRRYRPWAELCVRTGNR